MLFTTPEQFFVLAALVLGGGLIGYALAPSPKRWKRRVREQSDSFTAYHRDAEDRLRAANQRATALSAEADALRADHADAAQTIGSLRAAAPPGPAGTILVLADPNDGPLAFRPIDVALIYSAEHETPGQASPTSNGRDDLTRLRGVDDVLNTRLFGLGVTRFDDLEKLSDEDEMALEQRLSLPAGYILREQWRTQAGLLRARQDDDHAAHFATEPVPAA